MTVMEFRRMLRAIDNQDLPVVSSDGESVGGVSPGGVVTLDSGQTTVTELRALTLEVRGNQRLRMEDDATVTAVIETELCVVLIDDGEVRR